ncbi:MAG: hypothetical protein NZ898_05255 [Myxococcota bacterium]|nr:hypothetical protein [Myxococcota bacterium]MDW8363483.1 hypothetical protein [Myxococcales bacterium]
MTYLVDRRKRRSNDRNAAVRYQLEYARERGGIEALVLADGDGLLLAASGEPAVCAELGAVAPLLGHSLFRMPMPPMLRGADVAVRRLDIYGQPLFLAAVGGGVARDVWLARSAAGVRRILAAN